MRSYYLVVRFVPDPIADERINIGVIVAGDGKTFSQFLPNWDRVRRFSGVDLARLRDIAKRLQDGQGDLFGDPKAWSEEALREIAQRWQNCIQFSEPRVSLEAPDVLLHQVSEIYLQSSQRPARSQPRSKALRLAEREISRALRQRLGTEVPKELVKRRAPLRGQIGEYRFDLVVGNGRAFFAAQGLSFTRQDSAEIRRDIEATAFTIEDVRSRLRTIPIAVVAVPPARKGQEWAFAKRAFTHVGADLIDGAAVSRWAGQIVARVPKNIVTRLQSE